MPAAMKRPAAAISLSKPDSKRAAVASDVDTVPSPAPPLQRPGVAKDVAAALQARAEAAERRAREAELQVVQLQERASFLERRAIEAETALKEQSSKLSGVEARIAQAEGRAEVLASQAAAAASALERAARAEERAAVLGDLQTKLPMLIRAVVGSVSAPPWHPGSAQGGALRYQGAVKLELEDVPQSTGDPYFALLDQQAASAIQADAPEKQPEKKAPAGGSGGFMQRAMGAIAGSQRRKLKP